jgi:hypothetical protein
MSSPAHRVVLAEEHTVPRPFRAFAVRSDEPCHAYDARSPYGRVHVVATDFLDADARTGLARAGYAKVDIAEPFAVDYAATTWPELAAVVADLADAVARALRVTRVLGDAAADYERSVAARVDWLASRGAGFHNDVTGRWSRSLFWILALDVGDVEFVMPHAGVRRALSPGDLVVFDQTMAHGLCRPADAGEAVAESFDDGDGDAGRQLFLTGEMALSDAQWAALGAPWRPVEAHEALGALDLMVAEFDDRTGAIKRVRSLADCMRRSTCHVDETSAAGAHSDGHPERDSA